MKIDFPPPSSRMNPYPSIGKTLLTTPRSDRQRLGPHDFVGAFFPILPQLDV